MTTHIGGTLIGHTQQYEMFARAIAQRTLHHAYVFSGPESIGKKEAAFALARLLVCQGVFSRSQACGECVSCVIPISRHPDIHYLRTQGKEISIHDIRELKRALMLGASYGGARAVIINDAHWLSTESANALLKLVEEPSEDIYFFFISSRARHIPRTILSRVHTVRFFPMAAQEVEKNISEFISGSNKAIVSAMAHGRFGFALSLSQWLEDKENASALKDLFGVLSGSKLFVWPEWQKYIEPKEDAKISFHAIVEEAIHLIVRFRSGALDSELMSQLSLDVSRMQNGSWHFKNIIRAIEVGETTNASKRLAWEQSLWSMPA